MGLFATTSSLSKSATKMGRVTSCWASVSTALRSSKPSLRESLMPPRNELKLSATPASPCTSLAICSQRAAVTWATLPVHSDQ